VTPSEIVTTLSFRRAFRAPPSAFWATKSRPSVDEVKPTASRQLVTAFRRALSCTAGGALVEVVVESFVKSPYSTKKSTSPAMTMATKTSAPATQGVQSSGRSTMLRGASGSFPLLLSVVTRHIMADPARGWTGIWVSGNLR
jgi:hypothetical protein